MSPQNGPVKMIVSPDLTFHHRSSAMGNSHVIHASHETRLAIILGAKIMHLPVASMYCLSVLRSQF
jgi:hypothetical protein